MSTTVRQGFVTGSGPFLDTVTSVTIADTRVRSIFANGLGSFAIVGTSTDPYGNIKGGLIKFAIATTAAVEQIDIPSDGTRLDGIVRCSAPTSTAETYIWYG